MRRIATCLLVGGLVFAISGCKSKDKGATKWYGGSDHAAVAQDPYATPDSSLYASTSTTPDQYAQNNSQPTYNEPTYNEPAYNAPAPVAQTYAAPAEPATNQGGARYHTVVKRDTLYGLARTYYGNQARWKDIYEANRGVLSDPNHIRVGQRLLIP